MSNALFNTPAEEADRLVAELHETKDVLRELSGKLTRIETRLKRVFPEAFAARNRVTKERVASGQAEPTLTPESALAMYEQLVQTARVGHIEEARQRLLALPVPDLSVLRRELGAPLAKKKPSQRALVESILGRVRESVMLSKHTNRQELVDQDSPKRGPAGEGGQG